MCFDDGKRPSNAEYVALMRHLGMTPRTTAVGAKEQNGDVEADHGALKRRLEQMLLVRGSRDFESVLAWQDFIDEVLRKANAHRGHRVVEDLAAMRELAVSKLPEYVEEKVRVSDWSTVRVKHCAYSVPSRLMGAWVRVRIYEDRIEVRYADKVELTTAAARSTTPPSTPPERSTDGPGAAVSMTTATTTQGASPPTNRAADPVDLPPPPDLPPHPGRSTDGTWPDLPAPYSNQQRSAHDDTTHIHQPKQRSEADGEM